MTGPNAAEQSYITTGNIESTGFKRTEEEMLAAALLTPQLAPSDNPTSTCEQAVITGPTGPWTAVTSQRYQLTRSYAYTQLCHNKPPNTGDFVLNGSFTAAKRLQCYFQYTENGTPFTGDENLTCSPPASTVQLAFKSGGVTCVKCGDPINPGFTNQYQAETDYVGSGPFPLRFSRFYNSNSSLVDSIKNNSNWNHLYERRLALFVGANAQSVYYYRHDGRVSFFTLIGGVWTPDSDIADRLERLLDASGAPIGWRLTSVPEDEVETYDALGVLVSISNRAGLTHTLTYDSRGRVAQVTHTFGQKLTFTYDTANRIVTMTDPAGGQYAYAYDASNNSTSVTYPDGKTRTYVYNEPALTEGANIPRVLTGIVDENGQRFASFGYTSGGQPKSSEHAGGADRVTISYFSTTSTVTDAFNVARTYGRATVLGVVKNASIAGSVCPSCGPAATTYDANGFVASRTDWNGRVTNYVNDARGLETSRTEAFGTAQARTITTAWHASFRLPAQIAEPGRTTSFTHDANGNVLTRTLTAGASSRTWTYTYNANGQVLTVDGPRTDVADVTTYTYYANDDPDPGKRGNLATITNALGHLTQITGYNAHGQPLTIVDPNGLTTTLAYDARQRLTSRDVGGEVTTYTYDNVGQLTRVTLPDASFLAYTYDAAHRLTGIADNPGNRIAYTLDAMGNRTLEQVFDPLNQLAQTRSRVYSNLNRLAQEIGAQSQTTAYSYDNQGNLTSIDGPLAGTVDVTINAYDALNRLIQVTDPNLGQVAYGYNALDQLTSVSDPRSLVTTYSYDGLNNLNQLASPDTGATVNTYDAAGNLLTQTDAKGQVTAYTYDALNRVTSITYQGGVTHSYQYDQGANGIGRLTQITEPASTTQYAYDQKGGLTSETRVINAVAYVTSYSYDAAGRLTGITYPSGRQVSYILDSLGRISQIATTKDATTQTIVSAVAYRPFGPVAGYAFGNGQTYARGFDQDGRISSYTLATQTIAVGYDAASRIGFLSDAGNPANTNNYTYDNLDRLTGFAGPSASQALSYDAVGNRLTKTLGAATDTYAYGATSNRLASLTPASGPVRAFLFDANGASVNDALNQYAYDTRGRLVQAVSTVGTTNYQVNSLGQRIRKTNPQGDTLYHYDSQGRLIAESSPSGAIQKEYLYLGDIPVAVIQ